jgi:type II secretion system protein G
MPRTTKKSGFTIVELLIVIVVIGILAAITIVAFNGAQQRARDSRRLSDMKSIEQALALYSLDNKGGYPDCNNVTYIPGAAGSACPLSTIAPSLVPAYLSKFPTDPFNTGNDVFQYAVGFKKTSETTYAYDYSNNFITGMRLETQVGNKNSGWVANYYNYLGGSSN